MSAFASSKTGRLSLRLDAARAALRQMVATIIGIQEQGDFEAADRFVGAFCRTSPVIQRLLGEVRDLPIDIRIRFKTGEGQRTVKPLADRVVAI